MKYTITEYNRYGRFLLIDYKYKIGVILVWSPWSWIYIITIYMKPSIVINNWKWGIAHDDTIMKDWDCANMWNVDGRSEPSLLKLNKEVRVTSSTGTWLWVAFVDGKVFCDNGQIYNIWSNTLLYTIAWVNKVLSVVRFTITTPWYQAMYIWFYRPSSNTGQIKSFWIPILSNGTVDYANTDTDFFTTYNYQTNTSNPFVEVTFNNNVYIIDYEDDFLYISVWKKIYVVNQPFVTNTGGRIEFYFALERDIAWITRTGTTINIYLTNGLKYFWEWIETRTTLWSVDLGVKRVSWVTSWWNLDYLVGVWFTGQSNCIFVSQWQEIQIMKEWNYIMDWNQPQSKFYIESTVGNNQWAWFNHYMAFFPFLWDQWYGITSFWKKNDITDKERVNEVVNNTITAIWCVWYATSINNEPFLYFAVKVWNNWFIYEIDFVNKGINSLKYQLAGRYYTRKYQSPNIWQMTITRFRFRYDKPVNTDIQIYYAIDWSSTYQLLWSLPSGQKDFEWINMNRSTQPFYEIQFKIELSTTVVWSTPKLYSMELYESTAGR
jgi:hypothetical protein